MSIAPVFAKKQWIFSETDKKGQNGIFIKQHPINILFLARNFQAAKPKPKIAGAVLWNA